MNPYRLIARFYDRYLDETLYQDFLSLVQETHTTGVALDLATGTGQMAFLLAENGFLVDATDISLEMLKQAQGHLNKNKLPVRFFIKDILEEMPKNKYDVVTMASDVVNHLCAIEEVDQVFANVFGTLKEEGVFVFDAIHQEYMENIIGYEDNLRIDDASLYWTVKKVKDQTIEHHLQVGEEKASLTQHIYPEEQLTSSLQNHHFTVIKKLRTTERIIYLVKKAK